MMRKEGRNMPMSRLRRRRLLEVTQVEFEKYVRAHDIVICTYQDCKYSVGVVGLS
jgi:hypothetical protein